jgi:hypothetical protein
MSHSSLQHRFASLGALAVSTIAVLLSGCGTGLPPTDVPQVVAVPAIQGTVMGGETPIAYSQMTLWETDPGNTGYGLAATKLATTTSGVGGSFAFTQTYTCASGEFVYLTATGGDVTNGSASPMYNPNLVMVAALGPCSYFPNAATDATIRVAVNELTTVAAAYALGNFATVSANGGVGTQLVSIGAPANSNAATGACTSTGTTSAGNYSGITCVSAGLAHAFANAANLVNSSNIYGYGGPTGAAYTTVPGNGTGANSLGSVPQALINSLGDIMSYCTNSGNSTSTNPAVSMQCATFFADATTFPAWRWAAPARAPTEACSACFRRLRRSSRRLRSRRTTGRWRSTTAARAT